MRILYIIYLIFLFGCGAQKVEENNSTLKTPQASSKQKPKFMFVGDSLVAGYGVDKEKCFVSLIRKDLERSKDSFEIVNAGISGETSSGTLERIDWLLNSKPNIIFLCIGSNDGLRGIDAELYKSNLEKIIQKILSQNIRLIVGGIKLPLNYGLEYRDVMMNIPNELAKANDLLYYPFLLEGVAGNFELNIEDGVHPNEKGHSVIYKKLITFFRENGVFHVGL